VTQEPLWTESSLANNTLASEAQSGAKKSIQDRCAYTKNWPSSIPPVVVTRNYFGCLDENERSISKDKLSSTPEQSIWTCCDTFKKW